MTLTFSGRKEHCLRLIADARSALAMFSFSGELQWKLQVGIERDIENYVDENLRRVSGLLEDTAFLLARDSVIGAVVTSRACLETMAMVIEFFRRFKAAVSRTDGSELKKVLCTFIFASLEFKDVLPLKSPNVMDAIRHSDRKQGGVLDAYSVLCESTHPNWSGKIDYDGSGRLDWESANLHRIVVAVSIACAFSYVLEKELTAFQLFIAKSSANLRDAIFFDE